MKHLALLLPNFCRKSKKFKRWCSAILQSLIFEISTSPFMLQSADKILLIVPFYKLLLVGTSYASSFPPFCWSGTRRRDSCASRNPCLYIRVRESQITFERGICARSCGTLDCTGGALGFHGTLVENTVISWWFHVLSLSVLSIAWNFLFIVKRSMFDWYFCWHQRTPYYFSNYFETLFTWSIFAGGRHAALNLSLILAVQNIWLEWTEDEFQVRVFPSYYLFGLF